MEMVRILFIYNNLIMIKFLIYTFFLVECAGRADDQIKIRGFRIELGEIDTHLSQHPFVRENVTLVRRDKYEEQTLVSYFVPMDGNELTELLSSTDEDEDGETEVTVHKYRRLIRQIREYLKMKLPTYMVPSGKVLNKFISL